MQAQKEAPSDLQCKDKFLLQSVVASPGTTLKDITPEMVLFWSTIDSFLSSFVQTRLPILPLDHRWSPDWLGNILKQLD